VPLGWMPPAASLCHWR